jgi:PKHD-type hydroxylase
MTFSNFLNNSKYRPTVTVKNIFSNEEIEYIKDIALKNNDNFIKARTNEVNEKIRKSSVFWITANFHTSWIFKKLTNTIISVNEEYYNFDIKHFGDLQFTSYDNKEEFYIAHLDFEEDSVHTRKLSFTMQLSDSDDYEGGDLVLHPGGDEIIADRSKGSITIFPSYLLHEVKPVTKGIRYSLVVWFRGDKLR